MKKIKTVNSLEADQFFFFKILCRLFFVSKDSILVVSKKLQMKLSQHYQETKPKDIMLPKKVLKMSMIRQQHKNGIFI